MQRLCVLNVPRFFTANFAVRNNCFTFADQPLSVKRIFKNMTPKKVFFVLLAASLTLVSCKVRKQNVADIALLKAGIVRHTTTADITEDDIRWHISVLASDSMQGRMTGTPCEALAAEYIKEKFKSLELKAFEDDYLQPVPVYFRRYFNNCEFRFADSTGDYPMDFRPMIMFDSLTVTGEMVFAGYGFDDDYENLDVKGKWVMIEDENNNSISYDRKATAKSKGASGVLLIGKDGTTGDGRYVLPADSIPMIKISRDFADRLLAQAGTVSVTVKSSAHRVMSQNVVACLEASDSKDENEYIVIGAHYDHIGTITVGDDVLINTGADDNASGVAGLLEIAEKLCAGNKLKYSIIFAAFGAEEMGLVGSRFFCNNPPVPLEKIKFMINLDMIGRMDSDNHVYMNTVKSNDRFNPLPDEIKDSHPNINAVVSFEDYMQGSDHSSFFTKNIPVISFTTGMHNDYHTPDDTVDSIRFGGEKRLLDFVYDLLLNLTLTGF